MLVVLENLLARHSGSHQARLLLGLGLAAAVGACTPAAEPLVFPEWTIPVPEGTRAHEYAAVPVENRAETIDFERDLVMSEAMGRGLYRPIGVAADDDGRIFVLDEGNYRVVGFDQNGNGLVEFGSQGQGPGEFQSLIGFGVAGDLVVVSDYRNSRLSIYRTDGELVFDHLLDEPLWARDLVGFGSQFVILVAPPIPFPAMGAAPYPVPWTIDLYSPDGIEIEHLVELTAVSKAYVQSDSTIGRLLVPVGNPVGTLATDGIAYVTSGTEYQVLALDPHNGARWALRTNWAPESITEERRTQYIAAQQDRWSDFTAPRFTWPERYAAIENLEVDGAGNLWVFPYVYRPYGAESGPDHLVPVDVYSPDGEHLFSGLTPFNEWETAHGDHVFRIEDDPDSGEQVVARYRIQATFR